MYKHLTQHELYYIWQHRINKFNNDLFICDTVSEIAIKFNKHIATIYRAVNYLKAVEQAMNDSYDDTMLPFITITYDNGTEFSNHQNIANNLGCGIYFARPYKSCDRGLNEHTNGLIRRFFPKKTDFGTVTDEEVQYVQDLLNNRPRKVLNYLTPNEIVNKHSQRLIKNFRSLRDNGR